MWCVNENGVLTDGESVGYVVASAPDEKQIQVSTPAAHGATTTSDAIAYPDGQLHTIDGLPLGVFDPADYDRLAVYPPKT